MRIISPKRFREFACEHPDCGRRLYLLLRNLKSEKFENLNPGKGLFSPRQYSRRQQGCFQYSWE